MGNQAYSTILPATVSQETINGYSGAKNFRVDKTVTINGTVNMPVNKLIDPPARGGKIIKGTSGKINFLGIGLSEFDHDLPMFEGFDPGDITWDAAAQKPTEISTEWWKPSDVDSLTDRLNCANKALPGSSGTIRVLPRTITGFAISDENRVYNWKRGLYPSTFNQALMDTESDPDLADKAYIQAPFGFVSNVHHYAEPGVILMQAAANNKGEMFYPKYVHNQYENVSIIGFEIQSQGSVDEAGARSLITSGNCRNFKANNNRLINGFAVPGYYGITIVGGNSLDLDYITEDFEVNDNYLYNCFSQGFNPLHCLRGELNNNILRYKYLPEVAFSGTGFDIEGNGVRQIVEHIYFINNKFYYDFSGVETARTPQPFAIQGSGGRTREIFLEDNKIFAENFSGSYGAGHLGYFWGVDGLHLRGNTGNGFYGRAYTFWGCDRVTIDDVINDAQMFGTFEGCSNMHVDLTRSTNIVDKTVTETNKFYPFAANATTVVAIPVLSHDIDYRIHEHIADKTLSLNNVDFSMSDITMFNDNINEHRTATSSVNFGTKAAVTFAHTDISGNTVNMTAHGLRSIEPVLLSSAGTLPTIGGGLRLLWIIRNSANVYSFASSLSNAVAGTAATISNAGSGTHTLTRFQISVHTLAPSAVDTTDDELDFTTDHNLTTGAFLFYFNVGGTVIGNLTNRRAYAVKVISPTVIKLAETEADLTAETYINFSSAGTGSHVFAPAAETRFSNNTFVVRNDATVNLSTHSNSIIERPFGTAAKVDLPAGMNTDVASGATVAQNIANLQAQIRAWHPPVYLMDELSVAPYFLYSIRKPSAAFTGACLRVWVGTETHDIGYDGDWIDLAALQSLGFSNISKSLWLDVSGNDRHQTENAGTPIVLANGLNGRPVMKYPSGSYANLPSNSGFTAGETMRVFNPQAAGDNGTFWVFGQDATINHFPYPGDDKVYDSFLTTARKTSGSTLTSLGITDYIGSWHSYNARSAAGSWVSAMDDIEVVNTGTNTVGGNAAPYLVNDRDMHEAFFALFNSVLSTDDRNVLIAEKNTILGL